jgi:hypothetical protein
MLHYSKQTCPGFLSVQVDCTNGSRLDSDIHEDISIMSDRLSGLICDQCNSLLARPDHAIVSSLVHTDTSHIDVRAESIGVSAAKGCPICTLAEHYLLSKAPETSPETFEPADIEMSLTRQYDSEQLLLLEGFRSQYLDISY